MSTFLGLRGELTVHSAEAETAEIISGEESVEVLLDFADDVPDASVSGTFVASAPASGSNEAASGSNEAFSHEYGVPSEAVVVTIPEVDTPDDNPVVKTGAYVDSAEGDPSGTLLAASGCCALPELVHFGVA